MAASPKMTADDKEWQAESDLRTLIDAEKIKKDGARMAAAMKKQKAMKQALTAIEEEKETA